MSGTCFNGWIIPHPPKHMTHCVGCPTFGDCNASRCSTWSHPIWFSFKIFVPRGLNMLFCFRDFGWWCDLVGPLVWRTMKKQQHVGALNTYPSKVNPQFPAEIFPINFDDEGIISTYFPWTLNISQPRQPRNPPIWWTCPKQKYPLHPNHPKSSKIPEKLRQNGPFLAHMTPVARRRQEREDFAARPSGLGGQSCLPGGMAGAGPRHLQVPIKMVHYP